MSTRATYKFLADSEFDADVTYYIHYDGYETGALLYIQNAANSPRGFSPEAFLIENSEMAEFTGGHEVHGDTEYRYTFRYNPGQHNGGMVIGGYWSVRVRAREWGSNGNHKWPVVWEGTVADYIQHFSAIREKQIAAYKAKVGAA